MKLLRVKILGEKFRSLPANVDYIFNDTLTENKLSTKVFAGLNGSGKSNFLELIAEIFYYLERYSLSKTPSSYINNKNFGFEIEYLLNIKKDILEKLNLPTVIDGKLNLFKPHDDIFKITIIKKLDEAPEFSFQELNNNVTYRIDSYFPEFLPTNIIAYTSGQNELLSNPFIRLRYHYFNELLNINNTLFNRRMYFIDEESNYSIFVANMLLGQEQPLTYLKKIFNIEDLYSFRITINY